MLWHIVRFRFAEDVADHDREAWEKSLAGLAGEVPTVRFLRVGRDIEDAAVTGLIIGFDDERGLAVYRDHPKHLPVLARSRELSSDVVRLDVVTDDDPGVLG